MTVDRSVHGAVRTGLLVYLGVAVDDSTEDVKYLVDKIAHLRIFPDESGRLNLDVAQVGGGVLVISAFTLQADARKGRRPSFDPAARPERAHELYTAVCDGLVAGGIEVQRGRFRASMRVHSVNDGPVCVLLDSRRVL